MRIVVPALLALVLCAGCSAPGPATVVQAWASDGSAYANTDSLAAVMLGDGTVRVYATSKDAHRLDMIDASTGRYLGAWGSPGAGVGELQYPNGIAVVAFGHDGASTTQASPRAAIAVVERDNKRVQCFWPDGGAPAGMFGGDRLNRPYGVATSYADGKTLLYVTDTMVEPDRTVHVFELERRGDEATARHVRSFGDREGAGRVIEAESIVVDDVARRVLICDETSRNVKVYDLDGMFRGATFGDGLVQGDPEGLVVVDGARGRHVILTDQRDDVSLWHVFDAGSYQHIGTWTGSPTVANTDGIAVFPHAFAGFPHGGFFAVDDDFELRAYRLEDVLKAVGSAPRVE